MRRLILVVFFGTTFLRLAAQKVENVRAYSNGDQIIILYDMSGTKPDQKFRVNLYSSHNNFTSPVMNSSGDVGDNVLVGKDKRIVWNAKDELVNYKGSLSFEVRADVMTAAPPSIASPTQYVFKDISSVKRGGILDIGWKGGNPSDNVKLELFKDNVPQQNIASTVNTGSYAWSVPSDTKPGTYQLKLTGPIGTATSPDFAIKHKIATGLKLLPIVVIGGVAAAAGGGGGGGGGGPSGNGDLPAAPNPN